MEGPPSPRETPKRKKRNPSFRRYLRNHGIDVPPVVQGVRDPALPPKRKRNQRRPGKKRAKKRKMEAAAAKKANEEGGSVASPAASSAGSSRSAWSAASPRTASPPVVSPPAVSPPAVSPPPLPRPLPSAHVEADNQYVWDPLDPLGLFDELEGPLDWPSKGLFD
ncbi:hypothetical protein N7471_000283 [Penicillium samsonianum]|uniref:uncharacterized protein n=1 Tax=Penicillium samsonianum TaxID=1882272 RepID=UPI002549B538|nr:uncharacterized protein N7471_000283 [Penicillium samsonianum]KAJ6149084.1 hypothetical protein N7471_000283 [Penicillium samsonianum]